MSSLAGKVVRLASETQDPVLKKALLGILEGKTAAEEEAPGVARDAMLFMGLMVDLLTSEDEDELQEIPGIIQKMIMLLGKFKAELGTHPNPDMARNLVFVLGQACTRRLKPILSKI